MLIPQHDPMAPGTHNNSAIIDEGREKQGIGGSVVCGVQVEGGEDLALPVHDPSYASLPEGDHAH